MSGLIVVVHAAIQQTANQIALQIDPDGGSTTFTAPLVPVGTTDPAAPPTAYWADAAEMPDVHLAAAQAVIAAAMRTGQISTALVHVYDSAVWTPQQVLADRGLQPPVVPAP